MTSTWGKILKLSVFGQSRGQAIGMVLDGLPAGIALDMQAVNNFMQRRAPGQTPWSSPRKEADTPIILSGIMDGLTCGAPLAALIENTDAQNNDTPAQIETPRPGHADFTAGARYGPAVDIRGGGHFSGRLTAPLCLAGGICLQLLAQQNIYVGAHIFAIHGIYDEPFEPVNLTKQQLLQAGQWALAVNNQKAGAQMEETIIAAKAKGDSVGGIIECAAIGLPAGLGNPMFEGMENRLAAALFAIPGLKGLEFGAGFKAAQMQGSQHNDSFITTNGQTGTKTNNHGGILAGITSGMPLILRAAFKPTSSLRGRNDPCIVPRAVPCVEAVTALVLLDMLLERNTHLWK